MRGFAILVLADIWCFAETAYFGWNWLPHSPAEMVCDGVGFLLLGLGVALL